MSNINIIKGGLRQTVSLSAFEKLYKPNGWIVDEANTELDETQETVKTLKSEQEVKSFFAMKKREPKRFDDKLFKSET